jgi:sterol desaturase/sphingolipid hydroxylase (fatty acid hydroxylase superfamily)
MVRIPALTAACLLLWVMEGRRPFMPLGDSRVRHVRPNLVLAALTVLTNLAFAAALPSRTSATSLDGPLWLQAVAGVAILDFFAWTAHLLLHKTAWGWRTHRVHHSDMAVDVTTAFRQHPGETLWRLAWRLLPIWIFGLPLPVVALHETLSAANALLEHANLALPESADRLLRSVFVTPNMHKWHHSRDARETDTNYGNILSIWDRIFGTMTRKAGVAHVRYGLEGFDDARSQSLAGLLRMPSFFFALALVAAGSTLFGALPSPPLSAPLRLVQTIALPGVEGRIDHLAVDVAGRRLFVCALGNGTLEVIDLEAGQRVQSLAGFKEPQGVRYLSDSATVVVASGGDGTATFLGGSPLKRKQSIPVGDDADNVRYDATRRKVYVGRDGALVVIDPKTASITAQIPLDGHPESFQLDASGRIYVNVPQRQKVTVVDVAKGAAIASWPLSGTAANYPMALDEQNHRVFVATRRPPRLLAFDPATGRSVATLEIDGDADDLFYDAVRRRLYAICGEGSVVVLAQTDPDHYQAVARVPTAAGARTGLYVPELSRLYVAVPHRAGPHAEIRVFEAGP